MSRVEALRRHYTGHEMASFRCLLLICRVFAARFEETTNEGSANEQWAATALRFENRVSQP